MQKNKKYLGLTLAALSSVASAVPGDVDTSWQGSGHIKTMPGIFTFPSALLVDTVPAPDGGFFQVGSVKLLGGSEVTVVLTAKFDAQGNGDGSFGSGQSIIQFNDRSFYPTEAVVQPDGKLIVVGATVVKGSDNMDMVVCRVRADGALDAEFGDGSDMPGCMTNLPGNDVTQNGLDMVTAVALRPDGRIVLVGTIDGSGGKDALAVIQLLPSGDVDPAFGNVEAQDAGLSIFGLADRNISGSDVGLSSGGSIVVAGRWTPTATKNTDMVVVRFDAEGKLDSGFGDPMTKGARGIAFDVGSNKQDEARNIAIGANGSIVIGGSVRVTGLTDHVGVARLTARGAFDSNFGVGGRVVHSLCDDCTQSPLRDLALQPDGRIVLVGTIWGGPAQDIGVMRIAVNGAKDATFSGNGRILDFLFKSQDQSLASSNDRGASVMLLGDGIFVGGSIQRDFSPDKRDFSLTRLKMN